MSDEAVELARAKYAKSLQNVADVMRQCAEDAEHFIAVLHDSESVSPTANGLKRKRRKGDGNDEEGGKKKRVKDPNAPKRPASSFILFQNDVRAAVKEKNPGLGPAEIRQLVAHQWNTIDEATKAHYVNQAGQGKVKYQKEKAEYTARSPEEIEAALQENKEKVKRGRKPKKAKTPEKVNTPESSPGPDEVPVKPEMSSVQESEESSEESGSEEEKDDEKDEDDEDDEEEEEEEEKPAPKKAKVVQKPVSKKQTAKKPKA